MTFLQGIQVKVNHNSVIVKVHFFWKILHFAWALGVSENHLPLLCDYLSGRSRYVNKYTVITLPERL